MSPTNVFGRVIRAIIITGTNTSVNLQAEIILKTTKTIFDSTLLVIIAILINMIVTFANKTAIATPIIFQ